jgi:branched-chain amino acid transport system ATP-binding protein
MTDLILQVENLCKSFGALRATDRLSFDVKERQLHALIGPNGAGKTTLVNQLCGDILPDSGKIRYQGRDISQMRGYQRPRLGIARSFQITHIFTNLTVAENMALALCSNIGNNYNIIQHWKNSIPAQQQLDAALERVDLLHRSSLPAVNLSHGEKRQLEVGMALTGNPKLLILDEPMAGMGPGGTVELTKLIRTLKGQMTILLVEHDMDVVFTLADRITVLVYGENIATGSPEEIKNNHKVRLAYLGEE